MMARVVFHEIHHIHGNRYFWLIKNKHNKKDILTFKNMYSILWQASPVFVLNTKSLLIWQLPQASQSFNSLHLLFMFNVHWSTYQVEFWRCPQFIADVKWLLQKMISKVLITVYSQHWTYIQKTSPVVFTLNSLWSKRKVNNCSTYNFRSSSLISQNGQITSVFCVWEW